MTAFSATNLQDILSATWPAEEDRTLGPLTLRRSPGGGKRVTSTRAKAGPAPSDETLRQADMLMTEWGQQRLYMVGDGNQAFDDILCQRGFHIVDPTILYACALTPLLGIESPRLSGFAIWPMLAIQLDIWADAGIGSDRIAVMERVEGPRTTLLGRTGDRPAATAFVACHDNVAMIHALEVRPAHRRHGIARQLMGRAAQWASMQDCTHMALAVTEANSAARALYASLGMTPSGRYHYRVQSPEPS